MALLGDAVSDDALELRAERKHGAEHFSDGGEVVVGNPTSQTQELIIEDRSSVENAQNILSSDRRLAVVKVNDDASEALLAERNEDASADDWRSFCGDTVSEDHVERHGQGYVAKFGHRLEG